MNKTINRFLFVGGTWGVNEEEQKPSHLFSKIVEASSKYLSNKVDNIEIANYNGGDYTTLQNIIQMVTDYDVVFWFPNIIDNGLPKIRDVKEINPKVMLVTSKRNDDNKYSFMELIQRALVTKSNLTMEFSKIPPIVTPQLNGSVFKMRVFDPLGCVWADTTNIDEVIEALFDRLFYLHSITRQATISAPEDKELVMKWYFDQFKQPEFQSNKEVEIPNESRFIEIVRIQAQHFQELMPCGVKTERFIGNASLKKTPVGRCGKGMPSFKHNDYIFVSKRNIDKQFIELDNFVPVYMEDEKLYYCGQDKPSVDTPVQVRLYSALPNIKYILHSHCYIDGAPYTTKAIPCGAIEEFPEVMDLIDKNYDRNDTFFAINMLGHGSIVMTNDPEKILSVHYITRPLPERI